MSGDTSLQDDASRLISPSGSPRGLGEKLKNPLACPEIRHMQTNITVGDADDGNVGEIVSLRDHLGSNKNRGLAAPNSPEDRFIRLKIVRRIAVESIDSCIGKQTAKLLINSFGSCSPLNELAAVRLRRWGTRGTQLARNEAQIAVVADELMRPLVIGESYRAVRAFNNGLAAIALQVAGKAPSIKKNENLLPPFERSRDRSMKLW